MTLVFEVEFLSGVCFAAVGPDSPAADWPPQMDRVFSALTAAWAARGERKDEARALEWLERLAAPLVIASAAAERSAPTVFVPPNDPRVDRQKHARGVLPALRARQPRRFPAVRPHDPVARLLWPEAEPEAGTFDALQRLAETTAYVGHSASLTRCRFLSGTLEHDPEEARPTERGVYSGRLAELRQRFDAGRRPLPGVHVRAEPLPAKTPISSAFSPHWLILDHVTGEMRDLRAAATIAKVIRDALLSGYDRLGLGDRVPEVVSGHSTDGTPTRAVHLAIVPLPFVGFPHADGHVMGFALVPPRESEILEDNTFLKVLRSLAPLDEKHGRRVLTIATRAGTSKADSFRMGLSPTFEVPSGKRSLDPQLYVGPATTFATVTPIALDRHLKEKGERRQVEIVEQIAAACVRIGLPEPEMIVPDKHSAVEGAPSAYPSGSAPGWTRWRQPASLASRQLSHAVVRFREPVEGPVVLGAGRFIGLGLCRPLDAGRQ